MLEKNINLAEKVLTRLYEHNSVKVRICAAAHSLALKVHEDQAVRILDSVATLDIKVFSFEAKMTLQVWRKQGYLKVYPDQKIRYSNLVESPENNA
jgi:hypothetical protein